MNEIVGYIGTYVSDDSVGIYRFGFNPLTGVLSQPKLYYRARNAKCIAIYDGYLAAPLERGDEAGICLLDITADPPVLEDELFLEYVAACFVIWEEGLIYTANYHEGTVIIYKKEKKRLKIQQKIEIMPRAGCHQIIFFKQWMLVPCLELDCIKIFIKMDRWELAGEIAFPQGSGPRHGVFDSRQERFFVVSERSNKLFYFSVSCGGDFHLEQVCSVIPPDQPPSGNASAIRFSPDEKFLYVSIRDYSSTDSDLITVISVEDFEVIQFASCKGKHPRDFIISPDGNHLVAVNRKSKGLTAFCLDKETGMLGRQTSETAVCEGTGISWEI